MGFFEDLQGILADFETSILAEVKDEVQAELNAIETKPVEDYVVPYMNVQNIDGVLKDMSGNDLSVNLLNGFTYQDILKSVGQRGTKYFPAKNAKEILDFNSSAADGLYWFANPAVNNGEAFQAYCDMTTDGGGWMLILFVTSGDIGSLNTPEKVGLMNMEKPGLDIDYSYSILSIADKFKSKESGWQWMVEASNSKLARHTWGGIFTANEAYNIWSTDINQTNVTANIFWNVSGFVSDTGISKRVPWLGGYDYPNTSLYTTDDTDSSWWGNIVAKDGSSYNTGPWINSDNSEAASPHFKRLWIR